MAILWRIEFFGGLRARRDNEVITRFRTQKTAALLAYLALRPGPQPREVLVGLLWPDAEPEAARNSLSAALSSLRRQLEKDLPDGSVLQADRASIGLNPATITTDISDFENILHQAGDTRDDAERIRLLSQAVELYQGSVLPGFYDEWALAQARCREEEFFEASSDLIDLLDSEGQQERALHYARRGVSLYPGHEAWNLTLMRLLRTLGQHEAVLRHYREFESALQRDGLAPSEAAQRVAQDARRSLESARNTTATEFSGAAVQATVVTSQQKVAAPTFVASTQTAPVSAPPVIPTPSPSTPAITSVVASAEPISASALPAGTVVFLMTDVPLQDQEEQLLTRELKRYDGQILREAPDLALWVFGRASDAVAAVTRVQSSLLRLPLDERPRMALCSGEVELVRGDYCGESLERVRRLQPAANRGQILCCETTANLGRQVDGRMQRSGTLLHDPQSAFRELGLFRLADSGTECLFQIDYPGAPQFGPIRLTAGISNRLPAQFTRFFGRNSEIEQLRRLLTQESVRLLTLTGPGGSGKTRLAIETTRSLLSHWREAVWFVPLADISDTSFIFTAIRDTLKLPIAPNISPQEQIIEALSNQAALLLLDNFEQLVEEGAAQVQELLERLPSLTILITSRQVLSLPGEREFPVLPLPVPDEQLPPDKIKEYSSTALFIDRAQAARVDFRVDERNAAAVAAVCRRLDGIPLAIELAAARSLVLSPAQMLEKLKDRLDLLSTRQRGIPERHRTLRAAIEWSYSLLSPELQCFFTSLSVFRGGWTIEAAEAVCEEPDALDFLTRLRECSLVVTEEKTSEIRFRMLETLREYALSQLGDDVRAKMERRYATHFMAMAEDSEPHLRGPEQAMWLQRLDSEQDNFRAVLAWAVEHDAIGALRLAAALAPFWETRGHYAEGRNWLERALAKSTTQDGQAKPGLDRSHPSEDPHAISGLTESAPVTHNLEKPLFGSVENASQSPHLEQLLQTEQGGEPEVLRARALCGAGRMAWYEMDLVTARALLEESLAISRKCGDGIGIVSAINSLILVLSWQGEYSLGLSLLHEGKTILQQMPDRERILPLMANFGWAISWLSVPEAQDDSWAINSEVERLARAANDKRSLAWALNGLGMCCYWQEDYAKARSFLQECEIYFVDLGEFNGMGHTAWAISNVERRQGHHAEAYTLNADSMKMGIDVKNYMGLPYHLESFAYLAIEVQKPQRAVQLLAAAQKTRELYRSSQQPMVTREYESYLAILRPMLSEHEFQTAWAQGYAMTTQAAIEYSLQDDYSAPLATIAQTPAATELMRARALCGAGRLTFYTGDLQGARQHLEESLQLARRSGDELQIARALNATGLVLVVSGEFQRASVLFDEALAIARRTGDQEIFLDTLVNLGYIIADLEARSDTCALFEEGVRTARKAGDKRSLGMLLTNLGMLMCFDGQWEDSLPLMQEGLIVTREIGETWNEARTHWCLGHHTLWNAPTTVEATERRAIAEKAMLHFSETLRIIRGINGQWETPYIIEGFALMAIGRGEFEHGAWLFGVSESLRERLKSVVAPAVRPHYERFVSLARMEIGDETYAAAHAKGSLHGLHMPTEEALSILPPTEKLKQDLPL